MIHHPAHVIASNVFNFLGIDLFVPWKLVPIGTLLVGSAIQFSRRKGTAAIFQLIGAACLIVVIIAHVCEALNWFPWMHWGHEHSVGHYVDLVAAIGGLSLFPIGYLFGALTREVA